ncbi:hypothetical protein K504DRAFT_160089 [Pleomassaria siparia CBS 279.74]|uniref:Uncharacterized protein n=1 Tax=Pleomassaria siparia CBS 279.74 TaxID=1314801 RepID=A0A6G1JVA3_9PLEO|nr:hypothetical protein K504DRAFT_160089 [Pleomassaria siparia CBS 279.74]
MTSGAFAPILPKDDCMLLCDDSFTDPLNRVRAVIQRGTSATDRCYSSDDGARLQYMHHRVFTCSSQGASGKHVFHRASYKPLLLFLVYRHPPAFFTVHPWNSTPTQPYPPQSPSPANTAVDAGQPPPLFTCFQLRHFATTSLRIQPLAPSSFPLYISP